MKAIKIIRPVVVLIVLAVIAYFVIDHFINGANNGNNPDLVETSGVVEAIEVRVGTKVPGTIVELLVEEGDQVEKDQLIARIDDIDLRIQLEGAEAAVEQAKALYSDTLKGLRPEEIDQLESVAALKKAQLEKAQLDYNRKNELSGSGVTPVHETDMAEKQMEMAQKDYDTAVEQLRIARMGGREDQQRAASWALRRAEATVEELQKKISDSEIRSPVEGRVSIKNMEEGEIAAAGSTIVTIIDLKRPWVRGFVPEYKLGRVKLGMEAEIYSDSYTGKKYIGTIRYISPEAEFTPKNVQTQEERVKLVYAVKIYIDNPEQELKPGMPVDAVIKLAEGE